MYAISLATDAILFLFFIHSAAAQVHFENRFYSGAHQGGIFGISQPNSRRQFQRAYRAGIDIIEMDLRTSSDGIPFVFHDQNLQPQTKCKGDLRQVSCQQIQKCHYKNFDPPDTFEQVLAWALDKNIILNAEVKDDAAIAPAIALVNRYKMQHRIYFQTQNNRQKYQIFRRQNTQMTLLFRAQSDDDLTWVESLNDPQLKIIELTNRFISDEIIQRIHRMGKIASQDSFEYDLSRELFGASCKRVFERGIQIAISNSPGVCQQQKNTFNGL